MKTLSVIALFALCSIFAHAALYQTGGGHAYPDAPIDSINLYGGGLHRYSRPDLAPGGSYIGAYLVGAKLSNATLNDATLNDATMGGAACSSSQPGGPEWSLDWRILGQFRCEKQPEISRLPPTENEHQRFLL